MALWRAPLQLPCAAAAVFASKFATSGETLAPLSSEKRSKRVRTSQPRTLEEGENGRHIGVVIAVPQVAKEAAVYAVAPLQARTNFKAIFDAVCTTVIGERGSVFTAAFASIRLAAAANTVRGLDSTVKRCRGRLHGTFKSLSCAVGLEGDLRAASS